MIEGWLPTCSSVNAIWGNVCNTVRKLVLFDSLIKVHVVSSLFFVNFNIISCPLKVTLWLITLFRLIIKEFFNVYSRLYVKIWFFLIFFDPWFLFFFLFFPFPLKVIFLVLSVKRWIWSFESKYRLHSIKWILEKSKVVILWKAVIRWLRWPVLYVASWLAVWFCSILVMILLCSSDHRRHLPCAFIFSCFAKFSNIFGTSKLKLTFNYKIV